MCVHWGLEHILSAVLFHIYRSAQKQSSRNTSLTLSSGEFLSGTFSHVLECFLGSLVPSQVPVTENGWGCSLSLMIGGSKIWVHTGIFWKSMALQWSGPNLWNTWRANWCWSEHLEPRTDEMKLTLKTLKRTLWQLHIELNHIHA